MAKCHVLLGIFVPVIGAFVQPASRGSPAGGLYPPISSRCTSSLAYGPHADESEEEKKQDVTSSATSPFSTNDFQQQLNNELDPACSIDDEDCLAFSALDDQPPLFNSDTNEDPLCDPQDIDCQAFLPKTYLNSDTSLAAELKTRSISIEKERIDHNWNTAHCPTTFVSVSNSDWVRRVNMETYPIAVCGGARGGLYVVNLEEKEVIGKVEGAHIVQVDQTSGSNPSRGNANTNMAKQAMEKLYGKLDGGGVVAVAIHGDIVASSGREGGVRLWRIVKNKNFLPPIQSSEQESSGTGGKLVPLGTIPGLQNTIVTSLKFDKNDRLWTGCYDGTVRTYDMIEYDDPGVRFPPRKPLFQSDFTDSVLDMHLCEELRLGVCATADGGAALFNMEDGQFFVGIMLFEVAARSVLIMKHKHGTGYSVLAGGSDGTIHRIPLNIDPTSGRVDEDSPFGVSDDTDTVIKPRHVGPVMCMASPGEGRFVSGGQDGALRIWDVSETENGDDRQQQPTVQTKCMFALTGYKLWLGSVQTDGNRLISDGGESSVIVRDFSRGPSTNGKASL